MEYVLENGKQFHAPFNVMFFLLSFLLHSLMPYDATMEQFYMSEYMVNPNRFKK